MGYTKAVLKRISVVQSHFKKQEDSPVNYLTLYLKQLAKVEKRKRKPKVIKGTKQ